MKTLLILGALFMLVALAPLSAQAEDVTLPAPIVLTGGPSIVNNGAGDQTDPHVSGDWVTYTDLPTSSIHIQNLGVGPVSDRTVPRPDHAYDLLSDVSGAEIVLTRIGSAAMAIYLSQIDPSGNPTEAQVVAPVADSHRRAPAVGNGTIAFEDYGYSDAPAAAAEIAVWDPNIGQTVRVTYDAAADWRPVVSPDGSAIVWVKCPSPSVWDDCDVWQATRANSWAPVQLTGLAGEPEGTYSYPDTNGKIVVYGSDGSAEADIYHRPIGGGPAQRLALPGIQRDPHISGNAISFESSAGPGLPFDLMVYDLSTNILYQVPHTAGDKLLSDISVGSGGLVRVAWAEDAQLYEQAINVYAYSFTLLPRTSPSLTVQPLFDNSHAHRAGSVVPLRIQMLNAEGANVSSPDLVLTATGLVQKDDTSITAVIDDPGNSNPDNAFRYDETLPGYTYNLSTKGMASGTWELQFQVSGDPNTYTVEFDLR